MGWSLYGKTVVLKDEDFSKISQQFKKLEPSQIDPYINKLKETFDLERSIDKNMIKLKNLISDIKNKRQKQLEQHYKKAVKQLQNTINFQGQQQAVGNYIHSVNINPNMDFTSLADKNFQNINKLMQQKVKKRQQRQQRQRRRKQIFDMLPDSDALQKTQRQKRKQIFDMLPDSDALDNNVQISDIEKTIQQNIDNRNSFLLGSVVGLFTLSSFILIPILAK